MKSRLLLLAAVSAALMPAQQDRGLITGVVKDASGALIPDASIAATRNETNTVTKMVSSNTGDYTFPSLEIGTYTVRVEK